MRIQTRTAGLWAALTVLATALPLVAAPASAQTDSPCDSETVVPAGQDALRADCEALWEFYTQLDDIGVLDEIDDGRWGPSNPISSWRGVTISPLTGFVSALNIHGFDLYGSISPALGRLSRLSSLNLGGNELIGAIPAELGQLSDLKDLYLQRNELTGSIPPELGKLTKLKELHINSNELTGFVPAEFSQLTKLETLYLSGNELSGSIPAELGKLSELESLYLSDNELSGSIPDELGRLSKLKEMLLNGNELSGKIPSELGRLVGLRSLNLGGNELSGKIPSELGRLVGLRSLDLGGNELSDVPVELGQLAELESLNLGGNELSDIPVELGQLAELRSLNLGGNELSDIPVELGQLAELESLNLGGNELSDIPVELGRLSNLKYLYLGGNELSGSIPTELGRLTKLEELHMRSNELSGSIPAELGQLAELKNLNLGGNELSGSIPAELGQLAKLESLHLDGNELSVIPVELGQLSKLRYLYLSGNELSGSIPAELGGLAKLKELYLSGNELSGSIPAELGQLAELKNLYLGGNELSGSIPAELGRLTRLKYLNLSSNELSGSIPAELGRLTRLKYLDLSDNKLSGPIPAELYRLTVLKDLNLGGNDLMGTLPASLSRFDPYNRDAMRLISNIEPHQAFTLSSEVWNVWLCDTPAGSLPLDQKEITAWLNGEITPYYRWLSNDHYQPRFRYIGRVRGPHLAGCIEEVSAKREAVRSVNRFVVIGDVGPGQGWARAGRDGFVASLGLDTRTLVHEIGHALGFQHSYGGLIRLEYDQAFGGLIHFMAGDPYEYDNPMDPMSGSLGFNTAMIAVHRYTAGWLDPANISIHPQGKTHIYRLQPPGAGGTQMLVLRDTQFGVLNTLGARVAKGYDSDIPKEGVEAYKVDQFTQRIQPNPPAELIGVSGEVVDDVTKAGLTQHVYSVGDVFEAGTTTVEVLNRIGDDFRVRVVDSAEPVFAGRFSDDDGNAHEGSIEAIAVRGVTAGCSPTYPDRFCPDRAVTRAQMMTFLARALSLEFAPATTSRFSDVPRSARYSPYLERLADLGVVEPYEDGTFRPSDPLTRLDMAVFLTRAFSHISAVSEPTGVFADVPADAPYAAEVEAVLAAGVTRGCSAEPMLYCPDEPATRAQMASFLTRALQR